MNSTEQQENCPRDPWTVWSQRPAAPDDVCRALGNGSTLRDWSHANQFDFHVVANWLLEDPDRAAKYERSQQIYAIHLREFIIALADDSSKDILIDEKGKTTVNHAHFRRQQRQIDARKCALRELKAERKRLTKNQEPVKDAQAAILKLGRKAGLSLPAYNPRPPAPAPHNPTPNPSSIPESAIRADPCNPCPPSQSVIKSPLRLDRGEDQGEVSILLLNTASLNTANFPPPVLPAAGHVVGMASTPSPSAGSASASAVSISEKGKPEVESASERVSAITRPPSAVPSAAPLPTANHQQQTTNQPARQAPQATIGGIIPKVDWCKLLGVRKVSAFLMLFCLIVASFGQNLLAAQSVQAANDVVSIRAEDTAHLPSTVSIPNTPWVPMARRPEAGGPSGSLSDDQRNQLALRVKSFRAAGRGLQHSSESSDRPSNPSAHSRRSRDAP